MLKRQRRELEVLSVSALDLFASSLGVFILIAIVLFPYYLKKPALEGQIRGAEAALAAAGAELDNARRQAGAAEATRAKAAARKARAERALASATAAEADAKAKRDAARQEAEAKQDTGNPAPGSIHLSDLDLVFVMDSTGSMGEELDEVSRAMLSIIRVLQKLAPTLQVGFVAYRDAGEAYVTRAFPMRPMNAGTASAIQRFVDALDADGGGDTPEMVGAGLRDALAMNWRANAEQRIVVIGDAPARREDWPEALRLAAGFHHGAPRGGPSRRLSAIFTGRIAAGRQFFQELAEAGGGDYVNHRGRIMESVMLSVLEPAKGSGR